MRWTVSYAELNARANRLAHHLRGLGVSRGDAVGILLERSVDLVIAVVGVLKTGAAYLPLDPALPADRLGYMMDESGAEVVVSDEVTSALYERGRPPTSTMVLVDGDAAGDRWRS